MWVLLGTAPAAQGGGPCGSDPAQCLQSGGSSAEGHPPNVGISVVCCIGLRMAWTSQVRSLPGLPMQGQGGRVLLGLLVSSSG